ncbi:hypothetical protein CXG81DRAFT_3286, partial [Caulochytrium protostelioides]
EWNDVLRSKGIIPEKEPEITEEAIQAMMDQVIKEQMGIKDVADMDKDELDLLLEEDDENSEVMQAYRRARLAEMQNMRDRQFGSILHLSKPDYTREVTDASKKVWVVVFLTQDHLPECKRMAAILTRLAERHAATKFMRITATQCIENYPDRNCPTLLVYGRGELQRQIIGLTAFGGMNASVESVEKVLAHIGAVTKQSKGAGEDEDEDQD